MKSSPSAASPDSEGPSSALHHGAARPSAENTRSAILDLIRSSGTVSRVALAELTGLTQPSIGRSVKSLIDDGLVVETGFGESTGGKRPSLLALSAGPRVAVGVSLDVTQLTYVVTDLTGAVIGRRVSRGIARTSPSEVVRRVSDELTDLIRDMAVPLSHVIGIGIAGVGSISAAAQPDNP